MLNPDGIEVETFIKNGKTYVKEHVFFSFGVNQELIEDHTVLYSGEIEGEPAYYCEVNYYINRFMFEGL